MSRYEAGESVFDVFSGIGFFISFILISVSLWFLKNEMYAASSPGMGMADMFSAAFKVNFGKMIFWSFFLLCGILVLFLKILFRDPKVNKSRDL